MPSELEVAIERIERAFTDVRLESGVSIREADVVDDYGTTEQRQSARAGDEKNDWRRIPEDLIAHYYWCLPYFDARAMRFYLPAYMIYALKHCTDADMTVEFMFSALQKDSPLFNFFTPPQKAAVRRFLRYMIRHSVFSKEARRALDEVWMKGLPRSE